MGTAQINNLGVLVKELNARRSCSERISLLGTFIHRKIMKIPSGPGIVPDIVGGTPRPVFAVSGDLELHFVGGYDPENPEINQRFQEIGTARGSRGNRFAYRFFANGPWKLYDASNAGDLIAASMFVPSDDGFEDQSFVWAPVVERAMPFPERGTRIDPYDKKFLVDGGNVRIYAKIPDGI